MNLRSTRRIATRASAYFALMVVVGGCADSVAPTPRPSGAIKVVTTSSGGDRDDDGFDIVIDGKMHVSVGVDRIAYIDSMSVGHHVVAVEGVASNCDAVQPRSVRVAADSTLTVSFDVKCEATGVQITTQTSGPDFGPYQVKIGPRTGSVAANGTLTLTRLSPGAQILSMGNLPSYCGIVGDQLRVVNVTNREIAYVRINVSCGASDKVLAFVLDDSRGGLIMVSRVDGTQGDTVVRGRVPAWAPDGGKIMYTTVECLSFSYENIDVRCFGGLFTVNPDNGVSVAVPGGQDGQDPSWNPDGKSIVFSSVDGTFTDPSRLYVLELDGVSSPVELTGPTTDSKHPAWSPDGKRIAFQCLVPGADGLAHNEICLINPDGTGFIQLTRDQSVNLRPAWSPDGQRIAFATYRYKSAPSDAPDIAIMSADGGGVTRVAAGDSPAWSPDGSKILYNRFDGLFMSNPDGSAEIRITTGRHRFAAWRPPVKEGGPSPWDY